MQQFYYTSCLAGQGLRLGSGLQVRAASDTITDQQWRDIEKIVSYELPASMNIGIVQVEGTPRKLAYFNNIESLGGHVLLHAVHIPVDMASGRPSSLFVHVLYNLPSSMNIRDAIQTWKSPFWVVNDDGGPKELPEALALPAEGGFSETQLVEWIHTPEHLEDLAFAAQAWLGRDATQNIYIAGDPEDAAYIIYGLTYLIPSALQAAMTFSTYDRYPEKSGAHVVATWWPDLKKNDLPLSSYVGLGIGMHTIRRKRSSLQTHFTFIDYLVHCIQDASFDKLTSIHAEFERSKAQTPDEFQFVYDLLTNPRQTAFHAYRLTDVQQSMHHLLASRLDQGFRFDVLSQNIPDSSAENGEFVAPTLLTSIDETLLFLQMQYEKEAYAPALALCAPLFEQWLDTRVFSLQNVSHDQEILHWFITQKETLPSALQEKALAFYTLLQSCSAESYMYRAEISSAFQTLSKIYPDSYLIVAIEIISAATFQKSMKLSKLEYLLAAIYKDLSMTFTELLLAIMTQIFSEKPHLLYTHAGMLLLELCLHGPRTYLKTTRKMGSSKTHQEVARMILRLDKKSYQRLLKLAEKEYPQVHVELRKLSRERRSVHFFISKFW